MLLLETYRDSSFIHSAVRIVFIEDYLSVTVWQSLTVGVNFVSMAGISCCSPGLIFNA